MVAPIFSILCECSPAIFFEGGGVQCGKSAGSRKMDAFVSILKKIVAISLKGGK